MRITADTNVLVRAVMEDDRDQARAAQTALAQAEVVALALTTLCELVWVLSQGYKVSAIDIGEVVRRLVGGANVAVDRSAVEAGLKSLAMGGDFADAIIAYEGRRLGGKIFVSFDKEAVALIRHAGGEAVPL